MGLIIERIPHKTVSYAFLEVQASSANEFESLRAEALKRAPHYGFAANAPKDPTDVSAAVEDEGGSGPGASTAPGVVSQENEASASRPAADTPTEGLSPREKARAKLAAKKGA